MILKKNYIIIIIEIVMKVNEIYFHNKIYTFIIKF